MNKNLRLDNVQVYGFDYDYTLAHYSACVQALIYDLAKEHLVNEVCSTSFWKMFVSVLKHSLIHSCCFSLGIQIAA